jgi:hypothetical protein
VELRCVSCAAQLHKQTNKETKGRCLLGSRVRPAPTLGSPAPSSRSPTPSSKLLLEAPLLQARSRSTSLKL